METTSAYSSAASSACRDARRQVERKLGFYMHLAIYLAINAGLIALNRLTVPQTPWALGPLLGWGIGLLFHGAAVFLFAPGAPWKQRMIENELNKLNKLNKRQQTTQQ